MKRKRDKIHGQGSKKLKATPSSDVFRLKVASKLSSILNASLAELGQKTQSLAASSELLEVNRLPVLTVTVKPEPSSEQEDLDPLTRSLLNFIDSAKTRLSELFRKETEDNCAEEFEVNGKDVLNCKDKTTTDICTSLDQDSLQAQISEKFQSLIKKAFNTDILSQSVHEVDESENEVEIIDEEWRNVSVLLDDFVKSARKKINDLLLSKNQTERNNTLESTSRITRSLHKKRTYIPNSKCIKSGKYPSCDSPVDVIDVIANSVDNTATVESLCSSTQTRVLNRTTDNPLESAKIVSVDLNCSVNNSLDNPLVRNKSSDKCVPSPGQEFAQNSAVKSLKVVNSQFDKTQHINLTGNSFGESNSILSRTLRSSSLHNSTAKSKSPNSSTAKQTNIGQHQFSEKCSTSFKFVRTTTHQTKCKLSVVKSPNTVHKIPVDPVTNKSFSQGSSHNKLTAESKECTDYSSELLKSKLRGSVKKLNTTAAMDFGMPYGPNPFEGSSNYEFEALDYGTGSGILLMDEAEHAPDVLNLEVVIDERDNSDESSSEPEVLCLGEKVPTYEVVTIEEDDEATQASAAEVVPATSTQSENPSEDKSFECPHCGKSYKVESLLNFHVRMHASSVVQNPTVEEDEKIPTSQEMKPQEKKKPQKVKKSAPEKESSGSEMKLLKKKHPRRHKSRHSS